MVVRLDEVTYTLRGADRGRKVVNDENRERELPMWRVSIELAVHRTAVVVKDLAVSRSKKLSPKKDLIVQ